MSKTSFIVDHFSYAVKSTNINMGIVKHYPRITRPFMHETNYESKIM